MACVNARKEEFQMLRNMFPENHERYQILSSSADGFKSRFIDKAGKQYEIYTILMDTYPSSPPVWYAKTEEINVINAVQCLSNTNGQDNHMINQVRILLGELCRLLDVPLPPNIDKLVWPVKESSAGHDESLEESKDDVKKEEDAQKKMNEQEEIAKAHARTLERLYEREKYVNVNNGSNHAQSTNRLMKELRNYYRSDAFKKNLYTIEIVDDSIYEWNLYLKFVDPDSPLHGDLVKLKQSENNDSIQFNILFKDAYPFEPPFVRIVHPIILGGYVLEGGAICMELLTKQGWSSAYTVDTLILQISATLVEGNARIKFGATRAFTQLYYNLAKARQSFQIIAQVHKERGWTKPERDG